MKFSEMWLREWVNPPINNIELSKQLTAVGFQVEESILISNKIHGVVIGEIVQFLIHSNLNNTWILKVNNGSTKLINVICNSMNCHLNHRVVIANAGTTLPNGQVIQKTTINGQLSEGILCTFEILELTHYTKKNGIITLPSDAPIGLNFYDYLKLYDNIIDINVTPNRGDCLSIMGMSREIAIINQIKLKKIKINTITSPIQDAISITIQDQNACPQFLGRIVKNVNNNVATPLWIQEKLYRCGVYPTDVITDILNYVLLELGQPIHAFDYSKINKNKIYVRFTQKEETLTLYKDNINIKLFPNTLIIADNIQPLAIAGIIISNQFCICSKTRNILLQAAIFNSSIIAKQSRLYRIHTLSSIRYERGIDPNISKLALDRASELLLKICNGMSGPITTVIHDTLPSPVTIILNRTKLDKILGFHITDQLIMRILHDLGCQVHFQDNVWTVLIPTWRFDITIEEHLISEIIRIYGYDKIPHTHICVNLRHAPCYKSIIPLSRAHSLLIDRGYQEVITYSFVNPKIQNLLHPQYNPLTLINPISLDMSEMRISLWTGLIKTVIYNQNRQQKHIRLFESGVCFIPKKNNHNQISENLMIAGIRSGLQCNEHWDLLTRSVDFYDVKGDVEALLSITNNLRNINFKQHMHPALHPGQSAAIYLYKTLVGYIGMIHPAIQMKLNIDTHLLVFELSWGAISKFILPTITNISKFPQNFRDISIIVPKKISANSVLEICKKNIDNQLSAIKLVDVYTGRDIPQGFKSFTIKFSLHSSTHTLKEKEISSIINKCITALQEHFHVIIR